MHPHLANEKQVHCGELIDQLQQCHKAGFMHKYMGGCNGIKEELNACLREEVCDEKGGIGLIDMKC